MGGAWGLSDVELAGELSRVFVAEQALAARRLALVREIDGRDLARCGGATSLVAWLRDGLRMLVCGYHHRLLHHSGWQVRIAADKLPEFLPPAWIDPAQIPRRNTYHRRM